MCNEIIRDKVEEFDALLKQVNKNSKTMYDYWYQHSENVDYVQPYEVTALNSMLATIIQMQIGIIYKMKENETE